jgi:hypothetical protein
MENSGRSCDSLQSNHDFMVPHISILCCTPQKLRWLDSLVFACGRLNHLFLLWLIVLVYTLYRCKSGTVHFNIWNWNYNLTTVLHCCITWPGILNHSGSNLRYICIKSMSNIRLAKPSPHVKNIKCIKDGYIVGDLLWWIPGLLCTGSWLFMCGWIRQ